MANRSIKASLRYRFPGQPGATVKQLAQRFPHTPSGSLRALLAQAGPFQAAPDSIRDDPRDAFRFRNNENSGWNMTASDAGILRERFQREVDVVKLIGIDALRTALQGVSVGVPIIGTVGLPAVAVNEVIRRVTADLTNQLLDKIVVGSASTYGRCGGMAFAGLDYFLIGQDVPENSTQPASGPLREYIWRRLMDSLDLNVVRILTWTMQLHVMPVISKTASAAIGAVAGTVIGGPVGTAFGALVAGGTDILGLGGPKLLAGWTREDLGRLRARLDAGPGWPIGLIYDDAALVWEQHQMLALRYRELAGNRLELVVWDNNDGRMETTWTVDATGDDLRVTGGQTRDGRIKGILHEEYRPAIPPLAA